jgi:hypothetical protein
VGVRRADVVETGLRSGDPGKSGRETESSGGRARVSGELRFKVRRSCSTCYTTHLVRQVLWWRKKRNGKIQTDIVVKICNTFLPTVTNRSDILETRRAIESNATKNVFFTSRRDKTIRSLSEHILSCCECRKLVDSFRPRRFRRLGLGCPNGRHRT